MVDNKDSGLWLQEVCGGTLHDYPACVDRSTDDSYRASAFGPSYHQDPFDEQ